MPDLSDQRFVHTESAGGVVLLLTAVVALVWANSPWSDGYETLWHAPAVHHVVNDWLMALFFFVVGLEIKRELVRGELADRRVAALPVFAALGGMVVPAALYALVAVGGGGGGAVGRGWGIPMATDIAFALGVLALLGPRVPSSAKLFLLALAVVDDIGAIVVIALFYGSDVELGPLVAVALAFAIPARPAERLEEVLHPVASFLVLPVFALANAGVALRSGVLSTADTKRVAAGVVVGLVAGKLLGIVAGAWVAIRLRVASLPVGMRWRDLAGVAALGGIGFTVSLFVASLAFTDPRLVDAAKVAILSASLASAVLGAVILVSAQARRQPDQLE